MKKIVTILGARPQFVKAAVLSRIIQFHKEITEVIVHTGQHFDQNMSDVFFEEMEIPSPNYFLNINGLSHGAMTGQMIEKIEQVLVSEKPNAVIVYGDTNSTLAGALAAQKLHIPIIHIEAGLRSFNLQMPEELNRILTDRMATLLLCPTQTAIANLNNEGFQNFDSKVVLVGDIMKDAVGFYKPKAAQKSNILANSALEENPFVLATIHRQENTDDPLKLKSLFAALDAIHQEQKVVVPIHPRTRKLLAVYQIETQVVLIDPVGYFDMLTLLQHCSLVITDSGGLQKEAYFNQKYCLILREETEWVELVEAGYAVLCGVETQRILSAFIKFKNQMIKENDGIFGNNVGEKIYQEIRNLIQ